MLVVAAMPEHFGLTVETRAFHSKLLAGILSGMEMLRQQPQFSGLLTVKR